MSAVVTFMLFVCGCMQSASLDEGVEHSQSFAEKCTPLTCTRYNPWAGDTNMRVLCCFGDGDVYSVACRQDCDEDLSARWLECPPEDLCAFVTQRALDDPDSVVFDAHWKKLLPNVYSQILAKDEVFHWVGMKEEAFFLNFLQHIYGEKTLILLLKSVGVFFGRGVPVVPAQLSDCMQPASLDESVVDFQSCAPLMRTTCNDAWVGDTNVRILCCFGGGDIYSVACRMDSEKGVEPWWFKRPLEELCAFVAQRALKEPESVVFDTRWNKFLPDVFFRFLTKSERSHWVCTSFEVFFSHFEQYTYGEKSLIVLLKDIGVLQRKCAPVRSPAALAALF